MKMSEKFTEEELKKLSFEQVKQIVEKYFPNEVKEIHNPCTGSTYLIKNGKIVKTIKETEAKEQENKNLLNTQIKKRIREFDKSSYQKKIKTMEKELNLTDFKIKHIDFIITVLYQQREDFLKWKEEVKKMIKNKDFERFRSENYKLI